MIKIPDYVEKILNRLNSCSFDAYIVGGCVRDSIMGKSPSDWDICTSALPEQISECFKDFLPVIPTGVKHGTVTVLSDGKPIEVTTFRSDGEYLDNRRPESVTYIKKIEDDLARRDFTMNAVAYNPHKGLIDPYDGIRAISDGDIKCVGNPSKRFTEDALRIMRAIRFSAVCGFKINSETDAELFRKKELLNNVSSERLSTELKKLLSADTPSRTLIRYREIISVFCHISSDTYLKIIDLLPCDIALRTAALFGEFDADFAVSQLRKLKSDNKLIRKVRFIIENKNLPLCCDRVRLKFLMKNFGIENVRLLIEFINARNIISGKGSSEDILALVNEIELSGECYSLKALQISGKALTELGLPRGKQIGTALDALLDLVIKGELPNTKSALICEIQRMYSL